jgi:hypothetical protein
VDALRSEDARYVDPMAVAEGREAIAATIGAVQDQFPGFVFRFIGPVDAHHQARFGRELGPAGEAAPSSDSTSPSLTKAASSRQCSGSSTRFRHRLSAEVPARPCPSTRWLVSLAWRS